jgi:integrase
MERSTYKVPKFYLDGKKNGKPLAIIMKYTYAPGQRLVYSTGTSIEPDKWNAETQRVKRNVTGGSEINDILDVLFEEAQKQARQYRILKKPLAKGELKIFLDIAVNRLEVKTDFFGVFDRFINTESKLKSWTKGTHTKINTIRHQLTEFERKHGKIQLSQINEKFFTDLVEFWQNEYDLRNSTITKNLHILRWFFNWCYSNGLAGDQYRKVKVKLKEAKKKVVFLDMAELKAIQEVQIPAKNSYLEKYRDIFLFQCLTGLRFSDLKNLKVTDIHGDVIFVSTIKTGEIIEVNLNETTRAILDKYRDHQDATGQALPVPANQVFNRYLKELAKLAGLVEPVTLVHYKGSRRIEETFYKWQLVCSHTARRSFITNGLTLGIGSEVLRSWTGHRTDKAFQVYYEVVKQRKQTDMNKFNL